MLRVETPAQKLSFGLSSSSLVAPSSCSSSLSSVPSIPSVPPTPSDSKSMQDAGYPGEKLMSAIDDSKKDIATGQDRVQGQHGVMEAHLLASGISPKASLQGQEAENKISDDDSSKKRALKDPVEKKVSNVEAGEPETKRAKASGPKDGASSDEDASVDEEEEAKRLEAKRAYNRKNAARARQRVKDQLASLSVKVESLTNKNDKLEQANEEMGKKLAAVTEENQLLKRMIMQNNAPGMSNLGAAIPTGAGFGGSYSGLEAMAPGAATRALPGQDPILRALALRNSGLSDGDLSGQDLLGISGGRGLSMQQQRALLQHQREQQLAALSSMGMLGGSGAPVPGLDPTLASHLLTSEASLLRGQGLGAGGPSVSNAANSGIVSSILAQRRDGGDPRLNDRRPNE